MKLLLSLIFLSITTLNANVQSNLEVVDSLLLGELDKTSKYIKTVLFDKTELEIIDPYNFGIFRSDVLQKLVENDVDFAGKNLGKFKYENGLSSNTRIELTKISIKYEKLDGDSVKRSINIEYFMQLINANEEFYKNYKIDFSDNIPFDLINDIQSGPHEFLKSKVPKKDNSFFKKYTQPIIIIGSAVVSIILLFTIRSG